MSSDVAVSTGTRGGARERLMHFPSKDDLVAAYLAARVAKSSAL